MQLNAKSSNMISNQLWEMRFDLLKAMRAVGDDDESALRERLAMMYERLGHIAHVLDTPKELIRGG